MNEHELALRLGLPAETIRALEKITFPHEEEARLKSLFLQNPSAFEDYGNQLSSGLPILKLYLQWLPEVLNAYRARSIPEKIFWDGCKDFGIWCRDYLNRHGTPGLDQWDWISMTMRLQLFRLGRLQFEPSCLEHDIQIGGHLYPAGTPHLEVHIPAEEPLDPDSVADSFTQAVPFFEHFEGKTYSLFHCHSWLLAPELHEILPESSRILQFQSLFTVYAHGPERQAEERVFGQISDEPSQYPQDTSLQRRMRAYLMKGHSVGVGMGYRLAECEAGSCMDSFLSHA